VSRRPRLRALATRLGVLESWRSGLDGAPEEPSDAACEGVLRAMGLEASDEAAAERALASLEAEDRERWLDPVRVTRDDEPPPPLRLPASAAGGAWRWRLLREDGEVLEGEGRADSPPELRLPSPPPGVHELEVELGASGPGRRARQLWIAAPARCVGVSERLGRDGGAYGLWANLYSVRSRRNWGFGDAGDLEELVAFAASERADFLGLNPLHALWNRGGAVSPYAPVSRLFRNVLYLRVESVPEWRSSPDLQRRFADAAFRAELGALRAADRLEAERVARAKRVALEALYERCRERAAAGDDARWRAFERYRERCGDALRDFSTFCALAEGFERESGDPAARSWPRWPAAWRDPAGPDVRRFREERAREVAFHAWCQFELDRQLAGAAALARERGMGLGLYTDLALGSAPDGSDTWCRPDLFARGATAGAPPDAFSRAGQDWGFPPFDPRALRRDGYRFFRAVLRSSFEHAGALRIDHVMSLRRLYWVPQELGPRDGAYVAYPEQELLAILALESRRAGAVVIGEDLGTVPEGFSEALRDRDVLSSRVLLFEREGAAFRPPRDYPHRALATANTHDLPPLAALLDERDLELRHDTGQIPDEASLARAREERRQERRALLARLAEDGHLAAEAAGDDKPSLPELMAGVTRHLCATPCALVGLALDDLAGEDEPVNLPGVGPDRHPSWRRRMRVPLEALADHPVARAALDAVPSTRRRPPQS